VIDVFLSDMPVPGADPGTGFFPGIRVEWEKEAASMSGRGIEQVMNEHGDEMMAVPGVAGVAVGALEDGTPCILVLVTERSAALRGKIPATLEGHPVKVVVSGKIRPM
jgi:hypothetical protein